MSHHFRVIYENGLLRPLSPINYPEKSVLDVDVRDVTETNSDKEKWLEDFDEWMNSLDPNTPNLTDEQISRESIYEDQLDRQR